jgi:hypothetical protein
MQQLAHLSRAEFTDPAKCRHSSPVFRNLVKGNQARRGDKPLTAILLSKSVLRILVMICQ